MGIFFRLRLNFLLYKIAGLFQNKPFRTTLINYTLISIIESGLRWSPPENVYQVVILCTTEYMPLEWV